MAEVLRFRDKDKAAPEIGRVGERLMEAQLITRDQLQIALHEQRRAGRMLGAVLVQLGFLAEEDLASVLAERSGFHAHRSQSGADRSRAHAQIAESRGAALPRDPREP